MCTYGVFVVWIEFLVRLYPFLRVRLSRIFGGHPKVVDLRRRWLHTHDVDHGSSSSRFRRSRRIKNGGGVGDCFETNVIKGDRLVRTPWDRRFSIKFLRVELKYAPRAQITVLLGCLQNKVLNLLRCQSSDKSRVVCVWAETGDQVYVSMS